MILWAMIGRRCVCRVINFFFLSFLTYSPFCSPNIFFIPLLLSMALGQPNLGRNLFSTFGFHLKALSYELLVVRSLDLHINNGFRWHLFDRANGSSCPYFLSLSLHHSLCLCVVFQFCVFFCLFCVSAFLYRCMKCVQVPCGLVDVDLSLSMR